MIDFACPHCGHPMHVKDEHAGRRGRCKECSEQVTIPPPLVVHNSSSSKNRTLRSLIIIAACLGGIVSITVAACCGGCSILYKQAGEEMQLRKERKNDPEYRKLQRERLEFIEKAKAAGFIDNISSSEFFPLVWVTPKFLASDFDMKQSLLSTVWEYYGAYDRLVIRNSITNERIGTYDSSGLHL